MKVRAGFVSNSSAEDFICTCEFCEEVEYTEDPDFFHFNCGCSGHQTCAEEGLCEKEIKEMRQQWEDDEMVDKKFCPLCSMRIIQDGTILHYLIKKLGLDKEEIKEEMRKAE